MEPKSSSEQFLKGYSEDELIKATLKSGLSFGPGIPVVLREPKMPTGFPDVVIVYTGNRVMFLPKDRKPLSRNHFQVLFHLQHVGKSTPEKISEQLLLPDRQLTSLLSDLQEANLIFIRNKFVAARPLEKIFKARRIVAIEAKLTNWRKAIQQAVANLWFASQSYVLLPPMRTLKKVAQEAKKFGIGVIVFDGEQTKMIVKPKRQRIPISYGSWLINEWAFL